MGIPVVRGRDFTLRDTRYSPRVAIVNETFVKQFAGGADPIGQTLRTGEEPRYPSTVYEIVGVIPDTQYNDLRGEQRPMVFASGLAASLAGARRQHHDSRERAA